MAWKGDSRRHSLARKGIRTAKGKEANIRLRRIYPSEIAKAKSKYQFDQEGVYKFENIEEVLQALKEGYAVRVLGYEESPFPPHEDDEDYEEYMADPDKYWETHEDYVWINIEDYEGDTDQEILQSITNYHDWQLWDVDLKDKVELI